MPERDGTAVDVDPVGVDPQHPDRVQSDRGEGLVDLPEVDVLGLQPHLGQRLLCRLGRRPRQVGKVVGHLRLGDDRRQRGPLIALSPFVARKHKRPSAVVDAGRISGGVRAALAERRGQLGQLLERRLPARALVGLDVGVALLALYRHRRDLLR